MDHDPGAVTILYIAGSDRSGTTLLDRAIGSWEGAFSGGEIHQIFSRGVVADELCSCGAPFDECPVWRRVAELAGLRGDVAAARELEAAKQRVMRLRNIPRLRDGELLGAEDATRVRDAMGRVYRAVARATGARVIVDSSKHPALPFILRPDTGLDLRVVHAVRDSRGVVNSWSRRKPRLEARDENAYLDRPGTLRSCHLWNVAHAGCEALGRSGLPYTRIRYEDFVRDMEGSLARLARFAGLPSGGRSGLVGAEILDLSGLHTLAGNPMRLEGDRVAVRVDDAWRRNMGRGKKALVTGLTLPLLKRYGYV